MFPRRLPHPKRWVNPDRSLALLATVLFLPLVDGVYPTLVISGAIDSLAGMIAVGLLVFGGSATIAIVLTEYADKPRAGLRAVAIIGVPLIAATALVTALAPALTSLVSIAVFEYFAAAAVILVAAQTASQRLAASLPHPIVVVGIGMLVSFNPGAFNGGLVHDPALIWYGIGAATVGVGVAGLVALGGPRLAPMIDLHRFRVGSGLALALLGLSIVGIVPADGLPLAAFILAVLMAVDPIALLSPSRNGQGGLIPVPAQPAATAPGRCAHTKCYPLSNIDRVINPLSSIDQAINAAVAIGVPSKMFTFDKSIIGTLSGAGFGPSTWIGTGCGSTTEQMA